MPLHVNIKKSVFWANALKVAIPFFLIVSIISLLINNGSVIFSGDFDTLYDYYFSSNRWLRFLLQKGVISLFYGMYQANKNMR